MINRYELKAAEKGGGELLIYGDIGRSWDAEESNDAKTIVDAIDSASGPIDVRINSFGGAVSDGIAIFNALRRHDGGVHTYIDGVAYSIASLIAMAGSRINMAENAVMMIHAPWGAVLGNASEMRDMAEVLDIHAEAMLSSYRRDGGPDDGQLRAWLTDGKDHYFSAQESLELGLVDAVTSSEPVFQIAAAMRAAGANYKLPMPHHRFYSQPKPKETAKMADKDTPAGGSEGGIQLTNHSQIVKAAQEAGKKAESERVKAVKKVFEQFADGDPLNPINACLEACLSDTSCTELESQRRLLATLREGSSNPITTANGFGVEPAAYAPPGASAHLGGHVSLNRDQLDKRSSGLQAALSIRAGLEMDPNKIDEERKGEFLAMSLVEMMAYELRRNGIAASGSREDIARRYTGRMQFMAGGPSHGTDHLPSVLGNIANLSAMQGWEGSPETWQMWTQQGILSNYQTHTRANVALLDKLNKMLESQEWEYGDMTDVKQRITGYFYGLKYSLSIQAIVNDDLGELTRTMNGWGESASATVGDAVHALLFTSGAGGFGQSMDEDSTVLFHADHANYVASGSGAAPSEATLNAARTAMLTQSDQNARKVAAIPRYIIHGPSLWSTVHKLLESQQLISVDQAASATVVEGSNNVVRNMNLMPVEEYRIIASAPDAGAWALAAARRTIEVAGVGGPVRPVARQSEVSNTPGIDYELSMPFGAAVLDYRGLYMNFGS